MLLWCLIEKFVLKFGFEKRGICNKIPFLNKAFHGDFWKEITCYQQASSLKGNKLITGQSYVCLINPILAMSQTMSAFVL